MYNKNIFTHQLDIFAVNATSFCLRVDDTLQVSRTRRNLVITKTVDVIRKESGDSPSTGTHTCLKS